jgi:hypothetical protein
MAAKDIATDCSSCLGTTRLAATQSSWVVAGALPKGQIYSFSSAFPISCAHQLSNSCGRLLLNHGRDVRGKPIPPMPVATTTSRLSGGKYIRLLGIDTASSHMKCTLRTVNLDERPQYTALSYRARGDYVTSRFERECLNPRQQAWPKRSCRSLPRLLATIAEGGERGAGPKTGNPS